VEYNPFDRDTQINPYPVYRWLRDETPAIWEWTTAVPPETTINFGPATPTNSTSAIFGFTASEQGSEFECSLDGAAFTECLTPHQVTGLAAGQHTFRVRAVDLDGNVDPTPAAYTWTVDLTPPDTNIDSVTSGSIVFDFSSSEAGSTFECSLDGAAFAACTSPKSYSGLAVGPHSFQVRASDAAGNTDASPASHSWTVDTTPPNTTITKPIPPITGSASTSSFERRSMTPCSCTVSSWMFEAPPVFQPYSPFSAAQ
jgi:hypothetical protein